MPKYVHMSVHVCCVYENSRLSTRH